MHDNVNVILHLIQLKMQPDKKHIHHTFILFSPK